MITTEIAIVLVFLIGCMTIVGITYFSFRYLERTEDAGFIEYYRDEWENNDD